MSEKVTMVSPSNHPAVYKCGYDPVGTGRKLILWRDAVCCA